MQQNTGKTTQNLHSAIETDGKQMQFCRCFRRAAADFGSLADIRSGMSQGHGFPAAQPVWSGKRAHQGTAGQRLPALRQGKRTLYSFYMLAVDVYSRLPALS